MGLNELEKYIEEQIEKVQKEKEKSTIIISEFQILKDFIYNKEGNNDINNIITHVSNSKVLDIFKDSIMIILNNINTLKELLNNIQNNIVDVDMSNSKLDSNSKQALFNDIDTLKDLYNFAIDPNFEDQDLKQSVFELKNKVLFKINAEIDKNLVTLKRIVESVEIRNINRVRLNLKDNDEHLTNLKLYFDICNKTKRVETEEEVRLFLEFVKNSTLPKDVIYEIIVDFTKNNIAYYNNILRKKLSRDKKIVNKNKEIVHEKLRQLATEVLPKVESDKSSVDILQILTDEEKGIYDRVCRLLENCACDDSFFQIFDGNFSLDDRFSYYGSPKSIEWSCIKSDFIYILEPNLSSEYKPEILSIFNYILELNEKNIEYNEKIRLEEQQNQEQKDITLKKLSALCDEVNKVLRRHKNDLDYLVRDEKRVKLCEEVYMLSKRDSESAKLIAEAANKSVEDFQIQYILKELNDYIDLINKKDLNILDLEEAYVALKNLLEEYQLIFNEISKSINLPTKEQIDIYDGKNFVCFITENIDFENKGIKEEVKAAVKTLRNNEWYEIVTDGNLYSDLTHKTPSGKKEKYSNDKYSVGRIWATGDYRTGVVVLRNICPENKEKIMKRYNLEKVGVVAFVIGAIYVKADHGEYKELTDFMNSSENQATINYYVEMFMNKDTPEEKLFEVLEKGISDFNKLSSDQMEMGGEQL